MSQSNKFGFGRATKSATSDDGPVCLSDRGRRDHADCPISGLRCDSRKEGSGLIGGKSGNETLRAIEDIKNVIEWKENNTLLLSRNGSATLDGPLDRVSTRLHSCRRLHGERSSGMARGRGRNRRRRRDGHFRMAKNLGPELWIFSEALSTSIAFQWTWSAAGGCPSCPTAGLSVVQDLF